MGREVPLGCWDHNLWHRYFTNFWGFRRFTFETFTALHEISLTTALAIPISASIFVLQTRRAMAVEELCTDSRTIFPVRTIAASFEVAYVTQSPQISGLELPIMKAMNLKLDLLPREVGSLQVRMQTLSGKVDILFNGLTHDEAKTTSVVAFDHASHGLARSKVCRHRETNKSHPPSTATGGVTWRKNHTLCGLN